MIAAVCSGISLCSAETLNAVIIGVTGNAYSTDTDLSIDTVYTSYPDANLQTLYSDRPKRDCTPKSGTRPYAGRPSGRMAARHVKWPAHADDATCLCIPHEKAIVT